MLETHLLTVSSSRSWGSGGWGGWLRQAPSTQPQRRHSIYSLALPTTALLPHAIFCLSRTSLVSQHWAQNPKAPSGWTTTEVPEHQGSPFPSTTNQLCRTLHSSSKHFQINTIWKLLSSGASHPKLSNYLRGDQTVAQKQSRWALFKLGSLSSGVLSLLKFFKFYLSSRWLGTGDPPCLCLTLFSATWKESHQSLLGSVPSSGHCLWEGLREVPASHWKPETGASDVIFPKRASNSLKRRQAESTKTSRGFSPSSSNPEVHSCFQTHNAWWPCQQLRTLYTPTHIMNSLTKNSQLVPVQKA